MSRSDSEMQDKDLLSDLPDSILVYVLKSLSSKQAVQTCVLSKKWEHLWKSLTTLKIDSSHFPTPTHCVNFVAWFLSQRDHSISLQNVSWSDRDVVSNDYITPKVLPMLIEYAVSHDIQHFTLDSQFFTNHFPSCLFSCPSLTFLKVSISIGKPTLPKSLWLPALKTLYLDNVSFITSNNDDYAEPFSTCNKLATLVIANSFGKSLFIYNSTLTSLTISTSSNCYDYGGADPSYEIVLCTPRLTSLVTNGYLFYPLSSACDLPYLEHVNFDFTCSYRNLPSKTIVLMDWLHVFTNLTRMTISSKTLVMLNVLLFSPSKRTKVPSFNRLKSIKVEMDSLERISSTNVNRIIGYLIQNSPTSVNIITDA